MFGSSAFGRIPFGGKPVQSSGNVVDADPDPANFALTFDNTYLYVSSNPDAMNFSQALDNVTISQHHIAHPEDENFALSFAGVYVGNTQVGRTYGPAIQ